MRKFSPMKNELVDSGNSDLNERLNWKRRPSEIKGYQRALYANDSNGNYLRLDYSTKNKKVRIFYESADEGGVSYYSVIEDGSIITEKNVTSGRLTNLSSKFSSLAPYISTIPNREVLHIIGDNYDLQNFKREFRDRARRQEIEKTRRRYFRQERKERDPLLGTFHSSKGLSFYDVIDMAVGATIGGGIYYLLYNFQTLGVFLAIYGIALGLVDMFLREREPIFFKILLFAGGGLISYIYGYYIY